MCRNVSQRSDFRLQVPKMPLPRKVRKSLTRGSQGRKAQNLEKSRKMFRVCGLSSTLFHVFDPGPRGAGNSLSSLFLWSSRERPFLAPCSDSVKRHLRGRHLSVLNLKFDFISDGGCTREEQIALSLKRHLFPHGSREPKAFWICFSRVHPPSEIKSNFKFKTLKRHLLKRHLTLSDL